jgi:glycosyltransferase involved in cell wall biosynthesis
MPPMSTSFTVAVPTHDRRALVALAVASALAQTRPPLEVIVLADGCTDGTADALRGLADERVRVVELEKGPGYAYAHRNVALREARGDVVAWLGDDDLWLRDHLAVIGELWDAGDVELVQAGAVLVDEAGALHAMGSDWSVARFRGEALRGHNRTPMAAVSHRPEPALAVGGWDGALARRADIDLWRRMLEAGARTRMSATPTVLHPRGSRREQAPQARVAQNGALAAALGSATEVARLRAEAVAAGQRELAARERELEAAQDEHARQAAELDAVYREAARQRELLLEIFNGGWWRLRNRLHTLPLVGRLLSRRGA